jgi:hypothetical protein
MNGLLILATGVIIGLVAAAGAQEKFEMDAVQTSAGHLKITFIGHGSLIFAFEGKIIHVDPFSELTDYTQLPKADIIAINP